MYLVYGKNTAAGIKAIVEEEIVATKRQEEERRHRQWLANLDMLKVKRRREEREAEEKQLAEARILLRKLPERLCLIVNETADKYRIKAVDIMTRKRNRPIVLARNEAWYLIKQGAYVDLSFPSIARYFRRDHTVVMHGIAAHALANGLPRLTAYDIQGQRKKKAHRARTQYLWKEAA